MNPIKTWVENVTPCMLPDYNQSWKGHTMLVTWLKPVVKTSHHVGYPTKTSREKVTPCVLPD